MLLNMNVIGNIKNKYHKMGRFTVESKNIQYVGGGGGLQLSMYHAGRIKN